MGRTATSNYFLRALLGVLAAAVVAAGLLVLVGVHQAWAGSLSFAPFQMVPVEPGSLRISADLNGDGKDDLVVAPYDYKDPSKNTYVSVLLGNGDGTFQAKQDFPVGTSPQSATSADFNADGYADLATANHDSDSVSILLGQDSDGDGKGEGTFKPKQDFPVGDAPNSVISAQFNDDNADGKADSADSVDLAIANYNSMNFSVLLGNGDGTFQPKLDQNLELGTSPRSATSADFNADGYADLANTNSKSNNFSVLLGEGDGTFQPKQDFEVGALQSSITSADFNADSYADLAISGGGPAICSAPCANLTVFLANSDGSFQYPMEINEGAATSVTSADINNDSKADLVTTYDNICSGNTPCASVRLGYGDGTFQGHQDFAAGDRYPRSVITPDFDGDTYPDLAVGADGANVPVLLNTPAPKDTTGPTVDSVSPADAAKDVAPTDKVEATFSESMDKVSVEVTDPTTGEPINFTLSKQGSSELVAAYVSYDDTTKTATLSPYAPFEANATYTATIKGESSGTEDFVKDFAGNALADDKTWSFTTRTDITAPDPPSKPDLDTASDKGSSTSDDITNDNTPTFTGAPGSAESGSTIKILVDGVEKGSATAATDGSYSVTTSPLADGAHSATATATDTSGNTSQQSTPLSFTIDTAKPLVTAPVHSYTVPSAVASALSTSTVPVKLTWSGADSGSGIAKYELQQSLNAGTFATVDSPTTTSLTRQLTPGSSLYKFQVRATDKAGNIGAFVAQPKDFKVTSFQEVSPALVDTGTWTTATLSGSYGDSVQYTSTAGRKVTFSIPAGSNNVAWVAPKASNRGKADVYLDGVFQQTVDLYSASTLARQLVFSKSISTTTSHKLEVRVLGTKQSASTGTRVDIDAFLTTTG